MSCHKILTLAPVSILLSTLLLLSSGTATAAEYGEISIQHIPLCSPKTGTEPTAHGSIEYRFRIQNRSTSRSRVVSVELKPERSGEDGLQSILGAIEVPAGQTAQLSLVQPPVHFPDLAAIVRIDGRPERTPLPVSTYTGHCLTNYSYSSPSYYPPGGAMAVPVGGITTVASPAHIMVSRKCSTAFRDLFANGVATNVLPETMPGGGTTAGASRGVRREITIWGAESDPDQWSDLWLAYSRFEAVVLETGEMQTIPESNPIGKALRRYVETGGTLCLIGTTWEAPKEWEDVHNSGDFTQWNVKLGAVYLLKRSADTSGDAVELVRKRLLARADAWSNAMQTSSYGRSSGYYHHDSGVSGFFGDSRPLANTLPVSSSTGVPIRVICVLIVIFAVVIGPVNVYFLSLKNRRIWLLWTVPVISLIASGLVLGTNIVREGFVRNASISSMTILDQREGEAVSVGILGFYSTFTPPGGLVFENATEVIPMTERASLKGHITTYPGGEQNFASGWVSARVPTYFAVRKAAPDIRRLEFQWELDQPTVTNHIGANLTNFAVCSPSGDFYTAQSVIAGEKVKLKKTSEADLKQSGSTPLDLTQQRFESWATIHRGVLHHVPTRGSYRALIEGKDNPFLEPGIANMRSYQSGSAILGYF